MGFTTRRWFWIYKIGDLHSLEYIPGYGWFVINVNGDGFGDVSPTSSTSGTYLDANGTSQSFSSNFASSSNGVLTIAHGGGTITLNEADFFTNGVVPTPPTQITDLFASHASGDYQTQGCYTVIHSSSTPTLFVYQIGNQIWGGLLADHTISYDTNSKIWADVGSSNPYYVCDGSTWADTTASSANQQTVSFWQNNTVKLFELTNPYS